MLNTRFVSVVDTDSGLIAMLGAERDAKKPPTVAAYGTYRLRLGPFGASIASFPSASTKKAANLAAAIGEKVCATSAP